VVEEVSKGTFVQFREVFRKQFVQPEMLRIAILRFFKKALSDSMVAYVTEF
jgi:hypothetical protein